jgi:cytochrome P450
MKPEIESPLRTARPLHDRLFDPASKPFRENPYPTLKLLRDREPVHRTGYGMWICTRNEDVRNLLKDRRFRRDFEAGIRDTQGESGLARYSTQITRQWLVNHNAPVHTRLRAHMVKAISNARMLRLEAPTRRFARELVERTRAAGFIDLVADYAFPLTAMVVCEMLGVPDAERRMFVEESIIPAPGLMDVAPVSAEQVTAADADIRRIIEYFHDLCERKRATPGDDFTSELLRLQAEDPELTTDCIAAHMFFMFFAGHQSTQNLISTCLFALYSHPAQLAALRAEPGLIDNAVEELIRFDSAVQTGNVLYATEDVEIGGVVIRKGEHVLPLLGAANRDDDNATCPDRLDFRRASPRHCTFGGGPHFCIGARLATIEVKAAIETLLERVPALRIAKGFVPQWLPTFTLRGLQRLPAYWS